MDRLSPSQTYDDDILSECGSPGKEMNAIRQKLLFNVSPSNDTLAQQLAFQQPVQVYLRIRPKSLIEIELKDKNCLFPVSNHSLIAIPPQPYKPTTGAHSTRRQADQSKNFYFTHIYDESSTQCKIFSECVLPLLEDFFDGQDCLLFCYGVTNSGKSYTTTGTAKEPGILPRTLDVLFNSIKDCQYNCHYIKPKMFSDAAYLTEDEQTHDISIKANLLAKVTNSVPALVPCDQSCVAQPNQSDGDVTTISDVSCVSSNISKMTFEAGSFGASMFEELSVHEDHVIDVDTQNNMLSFSVWVSFAEIYNEFIYDLLADEPLVGKTRPPLKLSDDRYGNPYIKDLREVKVESTEEAIKLLKLGLRHRHIAGTKLNYHSSRSHAIFTIKLIRVTKSSRRQRWVRVNRISIVDLAGSERSKKTGAVGERCREACSINTSLLALGRCIGAMKHNQKMNKKNLVPFRDSKLTQLLQTFFIGKGKSHSAREGKIVMILNVSNNASVYNETAQVLKFSALASKVVPIHSKTFRALLPLLERSLIEEEVSDSEEFTTEVINQQNAEDKAEVIMSLVSCENCEKMKATIDIAKKDIVELKLNLWEQENTIRQQVSQEYNRQLVEIQENMYDEMEKQEALMENEIQKRMKLFQQSTKKYYSSRKRRCYSPQEEDEDKKELCKEINSLETANRRLQEEFDELQDELEMERTKHTSEMKDITTLYESKMTQLQSQFNEFVITSKEKQNKLEEEFKSELEKEINFRKSLQQNLKEEQEKQDKEASRIKSEFFDTVQHECETKVTKLEEEVRELMEENGRLLNQIYNHNTESTNISVGSADLKKENDDLKSLLKSYDREQEELLLQVVSLEAAAKKRNDLETLYEIQKDYKDELEALKDKLKDKDKLIEEAKQQEINWKQKEAELTEEMASECKMRKDDIDSSRKVIEDLENKLKNLENSQQNDVHVVHKQMKELEDLFRDNENLQNTVKELNEKLKELEFKNMSLEENGKINENEFNEKTIKLTCNLQTANNEISLLTEKAEDMMQRNVHLQNEVKELTKEKVVLEENDKLKDKKLEAATDVIGKQEKEFENSTRNLQNIISELNGKVKKLEKERVTLEKNEKMRNEEFDEMAIDLQAAKSEIAVLTEKMESTMKRNEHLQNEVKEYEKEKMILVENDKLKNKMLEDANEVIDKREREFQDSTRTLQNMINELNQKVTELENEKVTSGENCEMKDKEFDEMAINLQTAKNEIAILTEKMKDTMKKNESLQSEVKTLSAKIEEMQKKDRTSANTERTQNDTEHIYDIPPIEDIDSIVDDHIYDSIHQSRWSATESEHSSFDETPRRKPSKRYGVKNKQSATESEHSSFDETPRNLDETGRKLPLLDRSSQLRDSTEDFVSPKTRHIKYNLLVDAKKPSKRHGVRNKKSPKKIERVCRQYSLRVQPDKVFKPSRYPLRSRNKKIHDKENDEANIVSTPSPASRFKENLKNAFGKRKKPIRKSQISGPLDLSANDESPAAKSERIRPSTRLVPHIQPIRKRYQIN